MNIIDKARLLTASKIYLTEQDSTNSTCYEIRIQFPEREFVLIDISQPLPDNLQYRSLSPNGFGLSEARKLLVTIYSKEDVLKILRGSRHYDCNNTKTVDEMIALIKRMDELVTR